MRISRIYVLTLIIATVLSISGFCNNSSEIGSMLKLHSNEENDSIKLELLIKVANEYSEIDNDDSAMYFYEKILSHIEIAPSLGLLEVKAKALKGIGNVYFSRDDYIKALESYDHSLAIYKSISNIKGESYCWINKGLVKKNQGDYGTALNYFMTALELADSINDINGIGVCNNAIGVIHMYQRRFSKAIEYYLKAVEYFEYSGDAIRLAEINNNIGVVYSSQGHQEKALQYYSLAMDEYEELNNLNGIALTCLNAGISCDKIGNYSRAVEFCEQAIEISISLGYAKILAGAYNCMSEISRHRSEVASLKDDKEQKENFLKEAIVWGEKAYDISTKIKVLQEQQKSVVNLKEAYAARGMDNDALHYANIVIELSDSVFAIANVSAALEMTTRYETEKKELLIDKMEKEQEVSILLISKQKYIIVFSIVVLLISLFFSILIFRSFTAKRKAINELREKNEEVNQQKEEIETQRNELEEQRDYALQQKQEIDSSIRYAKRIQTALLPTDKYLELSFHSSFLLFKPKDVVSGDFYWIRQVNDYLVFAVADCTGHGVPGALMSMLGVSYLNEIVAKEEETCAATILNRLRESVIEALNQTSEVGAQKDGMDISIASINMKTLECSWAGANLPVWIIRKSKLEESDKINSTIIDVIKGDKMPVSVHMKMDNFLNNIIQLEKGDSMYLFTDGYHHQFGGESGKSFMYKPFMRVIASNSKYSMKEQKSMLEQELNQWMNYNGREYEQIDDITVLGITI